MNYDELVKMLRICGDSNNSCGNCPILDDGSCPHGEWEFAAEKYMLQAADAIEELQGQIDGWIEQERKAMLKSMPRWISVKERLPEEQQDVLVYLKRGGCAVDYFVPSRNDKWGFRDVTHWQHLPAPPKEE